MAAPPAKRLKYKAKDLAMKVEILRVSKDGVSRRQVMERYDVERSTLATYVKNEAEILRAFESEKFNVKRKRLRKAAHPKLEEALLRWIVSARDAQLPLSGPLICAQAEKHAVKIKIVSFKASEGWFARFKERHGLVFRHHSGFVRFEACQVVQTPDVVEDDDGCFDGVLPAQVQLAEYLAIDDGVVAGQPSDDEIIRDALCDDGRASDEDDCPCEEPPPRRTVRDAAEALVVLEEFCYNTPDSASMVEHLTALRKVVVSAQMSSRKHAAITDFFPK
ncbi:hypothetical protein HPB47_011441 [Ixodes persulcatus]|uniref:Uncharacterized protein n=1 Tax=Ixodes persulcatus TaxID=34615 RepID=A0AC60NW92_IXOPE|nr:hypothetical protein HPB47_011441 [Ixodes persulcatus]